MLTVALKTPVAVGANVTEMVQLAPAGIPMPQLFV
jgi:hypothetical protein